MIQHQSTISDQDLQRAFKGHGCSTAIRFNRGIVPTPDWFLINFYCMSALHPPHSEGAASLASFALSVLDSLHLLHPHLHA